MLRLALCALLAGAVIGPASAQTTGYTPPGGTGGMGVTNGAGGFSLRTRGMATPALPAARPDQVRVGTVVYSTEGPFIGRVAYADGKVAVVKSPHWALRLPIDAFGARKNSLLLPLSPANFDHLAKLHGARAS